MIQNTLEQRIPHRTVPRYNQELVETEGKSIPGTHMYDRALVWLCRGTSIQSGVVKLALCAQKSVM